MFLPPRPQNKIGTCEALSMPHLVVAPIFSPTYSQKYL